MTDHYYRLTASGPPSNVRVLFDGLTIGGVYYPEPAAVPPNWLDDPDALIYYYRTGGLGFNFPIYGQTTYGGIGGAADNGFGELGNIVIFGPVTGPTTVTVHTVAHATASPESGHYTITEMEDGQGSGGVEVATIATDAVPGVDYTFEVDPVPIEPKVTFSVGAVEFTNLLEKRIRFELNGCGSGSFVISRGDAQATEANLARGNIVSVTIPEIDADPIGEFFLEEGDFDL